MGCKIYSKGATKNMGERVHQKVFITYKFIQGKISGALKIDVFKIPDNKHIGKLFSKYELLFLLTANSNSDPS